MGGNTQEYLVNEPRGESEWVTYVERHMQDGFELEARGGGEAQVEVSEVHSVALKWNKTHVTQPLHFKTHISKLTSEPEEPSETWQSINQSNSRVTSSAGQPSILMIQGSHVLQWDLQNVQRAKT